MIRKCSVQDCQKEGKYQGFIVLGGWFCKKHLIETNKIQENLKDWTEKNPKAWEEIQLNALKKVEEKLK